MTPESFDRGRFGLAPGAAQGPLLGDDPRSGGGGGADVATLNLGEMEEILIEKALEATSNNRTKAAELLGISVRTLRNKLNNPS